ncbi:MAG TPA: hypothetical protein VMS64_22060 [Candidatus Methylomirabilis sp.]|nr:hypothetical protein [Candidatus Methylomirabilis sp.]
MTASSADARKVLIVTFVWFLVACGVGAAGLLRAARPPLPQVMIAGLTIVILIAFWRPTSFRRWALGVDLRAIVLIHVSRFVGIYFLVLYGRGELPYAFAVPGGWGDIAVAFTAGAICLLARPGIGPRRGVVIAWNIFGLVDIVLVVVTATRLGLADPSSMRALLQLPLSLLPTFLVPIIIATHIIIFARLAR